MGQAEYTDTFINIMLGWIRWLASGVAGMFQSAGNHTSAGTALMNWFADHWLSLLLVLIVLGVLIDWVVWMIRWRPYWLWFHKRRILIDEVEVKDDPMLRYARAPRRPHFESSDLGLTGQQRRNEMADEPDDEDFYEPDLGDDLPDDYNEDVEAADYYCKEEDSGAFYAEDDKDEDSEVENFEPLYADELPYEEDKAYEEGFKQPPRKKAHTGLFARRSARKHRNEEDPFDVEDDLFDDLDDDPLRDVMAAPPVSFSDSDEQHTSVYARPRLIPADEPGAVRTSTSTTSIGHARRTRREH